MAKAKAKKLRELKIIYDNPDKKLDDALEKVARKFGYEFEGGGFDFGTEKRDLLFTKE